jgi:hypothetical protein
VRDGFRQRQAYCFLPHTDYSERDRNLPHAFAFAGAPDDFAFGGECRNADVELPASVFGGGVKDIGVDAAAEGVLQAVFEPAAGSPEDVDFAILGG